MPRCSGDVQGIDVGSRGHTVKAQDLTRHHPYVRSQIKERDVGKGIQSPLRRLGVAGPSLIEHELRDVQLKFRPCLPPVPR